MRDETVAENIDRRKKRNEIEVKAIVFRKEGKSHRGRSDRM